VTRAERWLAEFGRLVRFDEDDINVAAARKRALGELAAILAEIDARREPKIVLAPHIPTSKAFLLDIATCGADTIAMKSGGDK
jgi:hypothetical protein